MGILKFDKDVMIDFYSSLTKVRKKRVIKAMVKSQNVQEIFEISWNLTINISRILHFWFSINMTIQRRWFLLLQWKTKSILDTDEIFFCSWKKILQWIILELRKIFDKDNQTGYLSNQKIFLRSTFLYIGWNFIN